MTTRNCQFGAHFPKPGPIFKNIFDKFFAENWSKSLKILTITSAPRLCQYFRVSAEKVELINLSVGAD
jgi:hypothetical protein